MTASATRDEDPADRRNRVSNGGDWEGGHGIERIVVALDPSAHSLAALEAAARMASRLGAELVGLFVEDINVRRLADLPFGREVGFFSASCRRVETQQLSRQLRVQAGTVRRRFRIATRSIATRCTFREVRGPVPREVLKAAAEADMVILGKGAWSPFETERLGAAVRDVLSHVAASTLVLIAETHVELPMRVVYDGTRLGEKAVATAAELAADVDGHLMVFLLADDPEEASRLEEAVRRRLADAELEVSFQTLTEASVSRLAYLVAHEERGMLILPAGAEALGGKAVLDFLDETRAPVLLIR
ncbi:MAG: universal stress protein [Anaerolineae bacterium]